MMASAVSLVRSPEDAPGYFGWRALVGAVIGLALSPGPICLLYIGALAPRLVHEHGWSFGAIMFNLTILNLASMVAAPLVGRFTDRIGPRWVLLPSIAIMAVCLLLWGYTASTLTRLYVISGLYGFATTGAQSITYTKLLTSWFFDHRGLALGVAAAGLGLGYTILPFVMAFGFANFGPAGTTALLAAVLIALSLTINSFVAYTRDTTEGMERLPEIERHGLTLHEAAGTAPFWLIAAVVFLVALIATGIVPNFASMGRDTGHSPAEAASIASVFGLATLGGRLLVGWLFDRFFAPRVACAIFLLAAVGYALAGAVIAMHLSWTVFAVAAILMGLGFGAESDLIGYLSSRYFGFRYFGTIYGTLLAIFILGVSVGPLMYGMVRDAAGSYSPMLLVGAALGATTSLLLLLLPRFPGQDAQPIAGSDSAAPVVSAAS